MMRSFGDEQTRAERPRWLVACLGMMLGKFSSLATLKFGCNMIMQGLGSWSGCSGIAPHSFCWILDSMTQERKGRGAWPGCWGSAPDLQ